MAKILIIGVGSAGANAVKHMKEVGVPNAKYITMGDYQDAVLDIPHHSLIEISGFESLPNGATAEHWIKCAELAKDGISEIIESHIKRKLRAFLYQLLSPTRGRPRHFCNRVASKKDLMNSLRSPGLKVGMVDYLSFYSDIATIEHDKELNRKYPKIKPHVLSILSKRKIIIKKNTELKSYDLSTAGHDCFVFSRKNTNTLCLLRHLRNSIAHWNIEQHPIDKEYVIIRDYKEVSKQTLTCFGIVSYTTLLKLLKIGNL